MNQWENRTTKKKLAGDICETLNGCNDFQNRGRDIFSPSWKSAASRFYPLLLHENLRPAPGRVCVPVGSAHPCRRTLRPRSESKTRRMVEGTP